MSKTRFSHSLITASFASLVALAGVLLAGAMAPAAAMSVTPIHVEMTSAGQGGRAQVTVTNDSAEPLPVEGVIQKMTLTEDGTQQLQPAGEDFLVFPPQALIPPGASQVFRVQWVGEPMINASESFLLSMNQIPVKLPAGKSAVQVVMSFGVVINVAPPQGTPALNLVGTGVAKDKQGKRHPTITVENPTNIHALLPQSTIQLSGGSWSYSMQPLELSEKVGIGLVQPGSKRRFILPVDLPPEVSSVQASLDFKPKR
jgi:P pilus assembly chaperone PapD